MKFTLTIDGEGEETLAAVLAAINGAPAEDKPKRTRKTRTVEPEEDPEDAEPEEIEETYEEDPEDAEPSDEEQFDEIAALVAKKSRAGKKEGIRATLTKFKVKKLPDLKPEQYQKFKAAITKL